MTTRRQTEDLNHPAIRELVNSANAMPLSDRVTLLKALIPEVAREMSPREFEATMVDLRLKGERSRRAHAPRAGARLATRHGRAPTWSDVRPRSRRSAPHDVKSAAERSVRSQCCVTSAPTDSLTRLSMALHVSG